MSSSSAKRCNSPFQQTFVHQPRHVRRGQPLAPAAAPTAHVHAAASARPTPATTPPSSTLAPRNPAIDDGF
jgi:hypothetical protein